MTSFAAAILFCLAAVTGANAQCLGSVSVALDENCEYDLQVDDVIANPDDGLTLRVIGGDGSIITGCGTFTYEVFDANENLVCWNTVTAEDKIGPDDIVCPEDTDEIDVTYDAQLLDFGIVNSATSPVINLRNYSCFLQAATLPNDADVPYELVQFQVDKDDIYTFYLEFPFEVDDALLALFAGNFVPGNPCENIIALSDDIQVPDLVSVGLGFDGITISNNSLVRLSLPLKAGEDYTFLVAAKNPFLGVEFEYNLFAYSDGSGKVETPAGVDFQSFPVQVRLPLLCNDLDLVLTTGQNCFTVQPGDGEAGDVILSGPFSVRSKIEATGGFPDVGDNCGPVEVCVQDNVTKVGDCDETVITRTFTVGGGICADNYNPTPGDVVSCTQTITLRNPDIQWDVIAPPYTSYIDCDESFPVDANGNPSPDLTGYPFVVTPSGLFDLSNGNGYCNLAANYEDSERIVGCGSTYKIVRTWYILDHCDPVKSTEYRQIIKVGDYNGPDINVGGGKNLQISTDALNCTGTLFVPKPTLSDKCEVTLDQYTVEIIAFTGCETQPEAAPVFASFTGRISGGQIIVSDIPKGTHTLRYRAGDNCGNASFTDICFTVTDQVAPVAIVDDNLHISIGGPNANFPDPTRPGGYARVTAADIDEGSYDNCGPVNLEVRRRLDVECLDDPDIIAILDAVENGGNGNGVIVDDDLDGVKEEEVVLEFDPYEGENAYFTCYKDYVDIFCCDLGKDVRIELRVWDNGDMDSVIGFVDETPVFSDGKYINFPYRKYDAGDNSNVSWLDVLVEDKLPPICENLPPVTLTCLELPHDFPDNANFGFGQIPAEFESLLNDLFGEPWGFDNCAETDVEQAVSFDLLCRAGVITRRFQAVDASGARSSICSQTINVTLVNEYLIKFPKDADNVCGTLNADTIEVFEEACDILAVSVDDDFFSASGDECFKIKRTYEVINWCEYDGQSDPVIINRDEDCDGVPGDEDVWLIRRPTPAATNVPYIFIDRDNNETNGNPFAGAKSTACDGTTNPNGYWTDNFLAAAANPSRDFTQPGSSREARGYYRYVQFIKVYDDVSPIIEVEDFEPFCSIDNVNCDGMVEIVFTPSDECTPEDLNVVLFLDAFVVDANGDGVITSEEHTPDQNVTSLAAIENGVYTFRGEFPIGQHALEVKVSDGCGNSTVRIIPFEVIDCKAPTPICINGVTVTLMPTEPGTDADGDGDEDTGAMVLWASDVIASPITDCTPGISYAIYRAADVEAAGGPGTFVPDANDTDIIFTCDDDLNTVIYVYAIDGANNFDFCETYVLVQRNNEMTSCEETEGEGMLSGAIVTGESLETIAGVNVALSGSMNSGMVTGNDGQFIFTGLQLQQDYSVTPTLDANPTNGVSTFDLVLISKHILQKELLDTPLKMIAADANNSRSITAADLITLRRLILGTITSLPNNTSWRFVDASYSFPNSNNPWAEPFREVFNVNDLAGDMLNANFYGVKIGDVNLSAKANALTNAEVRTNGTFAFDVADAALTAGDIYTVDFTAADVANIAGFQGTFTLNDAELVDIVYGVAGADNFAVHNNAVAFSWNGEASANDVLFSLVVRAGNDAPLSQVLGVSNRVATAEAYTNDGELRNVAINFSTGAVASAGFELGQNTPNPFVGETLINFTLPTASDVTLRVSDVTGRTVLVKRTSGVAGVNTINVTRTELGATGVFTYTLTAGEFTATRKMIVVN